MENYGNIIKEQMKNVITDDDINRLAEYSDQLKKSIGSDFSLDKILTDTLAGKSIFEPTDIIDSLKNLFLYEVHDTLSLGISVLAICVICGILKNLSSSLGKNSVSQIAMLCCSVIIAGLCIENFHTVYVLLTDTIGTLTSVMEILLPILIGALISMGAVTSGTVLSPLLLTILTLFQVFIKKIIFPAIFTSVVLRLINSLTEKDYISKMSKFLRNGSLFLTGIMTTILSGIVKIQGLLSDTSDSLLIGTAKYSLDSFIPIVGGFASDTVELFLKCMKSIKGVLGIFGILMILFILLSPLIKILAISVVYKLTALIVEPITDKRISDAINEMGTSLITMGAILLFSSMMLILFITSIIRIGGSG